MLLELRKELGINSANYFTSQYLTPMKREGYIEIEKGVNMCNSRVDPRIQLWGNGVRGRSAAVH